MKLLFPNISLLLILSLLLSSEAFAHGLVQSPKSRNQVCGVEIKPDAAAGTACEAAFVNDFSGGYSFMSVLTHDVGRAGVSPLPTNVCGFDSETWNGGASPWDSAIDWPTQDMDPGRQAFVWNIEWGPHFDDTEEFRYWITKDDFDFVVGQPLTWDDFESEAFCYLTYDDKNPGANPDVVSDKPNTEFTTFCNVPERSGRHVIYAEWGRNFFTFERFHGCIDAQFDGNTSPPPIPSPSPSPTPLPGNAVPQANSQSVEVDSGDSVSITLSGSDSDGSISAYNLVSTPSNGSLSGNAPNLSYAPNAGFTGTDQFRFSVTDDDGAISPQALVTITVNDSQSPPSGDGELMCDYVIANSWNTGFVANIRLTNTGDQPVFGWEVSWQYTDGSSITSLWNANLSGNNPYTASNLGWNDTIAPGDTVEFGFQGALGGSTASIPQVTGDNCE